MDAFDADVAAGDNRAYLVLPPGAGKTMIGLEAARRLGRRSLVLVPNTAVQAQWAAAWDNSFPSSDRSASKCGTERGLASAMNVLTYQSLAVIDAETDSTVRREVLRNRDQQALLDLLHPNGRAVIERAATLGPWTLVLDECHHLLATWGALVSALASVLGAQTALIGLTATPATELTAWQHTLHDELFGTADFVIPTPALVREGDLAPYQELVYLTQPTPEEQAWIGTHRARFADLMLALIDQKVGSMSLAAWLHTRIVDRATREGNQIAWSTFERAEPDLACSGLRFAYDGLIPLPDGVRLREQHRIAPDAQDWVNVLTDFSVGHLQQSADPRDAHALTAIKRVLPGLGYRLTSRGVRVATSPVDRLCALSESKIAATAHILDTEDAVLGARLRALVLCDFESMTGALPTSLKGAPVSEQSGSAQLVAAMLAASDHRRRTPLHALLVTGQTFACPAAIEDDLIAFCAERGALVTAEPLDAHPSLRVMRGTGGFTPRTWVALATEYFLAGRARVLVGTRSLLGEGWDCAAVNVNIDLTSATTQAAITQMRGRAIRNDPSDGHKVADNWSVCCIATEHPRGDADYLRLVRKHDGYYAATPQGLIESGVTHCDPSLSPYGPPVTDTHAITARALQRVAERAQARSWWRIGEPYEGVDVATIRVRSRQPLGVAAPRIPASALTPPVPGTVQSGPPGKGCRGRRFRGRRQHRHRSCLRQSRHAGGCRHGRRHRRGGCWPGGNRCGGRKPPPGPRAQRARATGRRRRGCAVRRGRRTARIRGTTVGLRPRRLDPVSTRRRAHRAVPAVHRGPRRATGAACRTALPHRTQDPHAARPARCPEAVRGSCRRRAIAARHGCLARRAPLVRTKQGSAATSGTGMAKAHRPTPTTASRLPTRASHPRSVPRR